MSKEEWVEKEIEEYKQQHAEVSAHTLNVLRDMKRREFDQLEREAVRVDSYTGGDDQ